MKLLQMITDFYNTENSRPAFIDNCELFFDEENTRMLLRLALRDGSTKIKNVRIDVCSYDKDGLILSVLENIEYEGKMEIPLHSLMTYSVAVILRQAELPDGSVWTSETKFPAQIPVKTTEDTFADTARFDPTSITAAQNKRELRRERFAREEEIRQIIKNDPKERKKRIITRLVALFVTISTLTVGGLAVKYTDSANSAYKRASNLYNSGKFEEAIPALKEASEFIFFGEERSELYWRLAMSYARERDFYNAAVYFSNLGDYKESKANYQSIAEAYKNIISAGGEHTLGLHGDGTVVAVGNNKYEQCEVETWSEITQVSAGGRHSVAVTDMGTVVATGDNTNKQCEVDNWRNITDISAGTAHTVGVKGSGSVVATGDNEYGQCDVDGWSGVVSVSAGDTHTVALRIDGTAVATGNNEYGQCNVDKWENIVSVAAGYSFTAGLTFDGEILVAGNLGTDISALSDIKNCLFISAGDYNILSVSKDGSVCSVGSNGNNQGATSVWTGIAATDGGSRHSVGVSADGNAFAAGENKYGQTDLVDWGNISIPKNTVTIR
ncbi:MAG: hypothetical protein IJA16_05190 [Clostridia bacterium]|nr:hypothetical protein [Clostridia bacterium]